MVFARETSSSLTSLVKKLDAATQENTKNKMGSFVVFLNDEEGLQTKLKDLVTKEGLKKIILAIDNPAGPQGYGVSKDADITVVLYVNRTVKANHAFKKGELKDADIEAIVKDVAKILPGSK